MTVCILTVYLDDNAKRERVVQLTVKAGDIAKSLPKLCEQLKSQARIPPARQAETRQNIGAELGSTDREELGDEDGTFEGASLGLLDGEELGIPDGASDGEAVGSSESFDDGPSFGVHEMRDWQLQYCTTESLLPSRFSQKVDYIV